MLLKGKDVIALFLPKEAGILHPAERQSELLLPQGNAHVEDGGFQLSASLAGRQPAPED